MDFDGGSNVYFKIQPPTATGFGDPEIWPVVDTSALSFIKLTVDEYELSLKVRISGSVVDYDRFFNVEIVETSTVTVGEDIDAIAPSFTVPAGERDGYVTVNVHRTETMSEEILYLTLRLVPSDDFNVNISTWDTDYGQGSIKDDGSYPRVDEHTVTITNLVVQPSTWNAYMAGDYHYSKFMLMCELGDVAVSEFDNTTTMPSARFIALCITLKNYLDYKEEQGETVYLTDFKGEYELDEQGERIPMEVAAALSW